MPVVRFLRSHTCNIAEFCSLRDSQSQWHRAPLNNIDRGWLRQRKVLSVFEKSRIKNDFSHLQDRNRLSGQNLQLSETRSLFIYLADKMLTGFLLSLRMG